MYQILKKQDTANFFKVGNCCDVEYGDGGYDPIRYPLYFAKNINLNNNQQLIECLLRLGDEKNDWHENVPVQDIVDPELYPVYFKQTPHTDNINVDDPKNDEIFIKWGRDPRRVIRGIKKDPKSRTCIAPERYKYHWKTTEFVVGKMLESVSINGQIPGVKFDDYPGVYTFLERIFHAMLPAFNKIGKNSFHIQIEFRLLLSIKSLVLEKCSFRLYHISISGCCAFFGYMTLQHILTVLAD